jgi:hypothetical protein
LSCEYYNGDRKHHGLVRIGLSAEFLVALFMSSLKVQHFSIFHKKQIGTAAGVTNHLFPESTLLAMHTTYSRNIMSQKCGGICGLWVLNESV